MTINATDINFMQQQNYPTSPPTQQAPENVLAELFIYLLTLMCAESDTCSDVFEIIFAGLITVGSIAIAKLPVKAQEYRHPEQTIAKFSMGVLWPLSALGGGYAGVKEYNHYLRYMPDADSVDKFNAIATGSLSGALVTTVFSSISASLVHVGTPKITTLYNRIGTACERSSAIESYRPLEDDDPENQTSRRSSRCRRICGG